MASAFLGINGRVIRLEDVPQDPIVYAYDHEVELGIKVEPIKGKPGYAVVTHSTVKVPGHSFSVSNEAIEVDGQVVKDMGDPQSVVGGYWRYHVGAGGETRVDVHFHDWAIALLVADGTLPHLKSGILDGVRHLGVFVDARPSQVAGLINE